MKVKVLRYPDRFGEDLQPIEGRVGDVIDTMPFFLVAIKGQGVFWVASENVQEVEEERRA